MLFFAALFWSRVGHRILVNGFASRARILRTMIPPYVFGSATARWSNHGIRFPLEFWTAHTQLSRSIPPKCRGLGTTAANFEPATSRGKVGACLHPACIVHLNSTAQTAPAIATPQPRTWKTPPVRLLWLFGAPL